MDDSVALLASGAGVKGFESYSNLNTASYGIPTENTRAAALKMCKEESMLFSCSADGVIRCWDEFLRTEVYQFKYDTSDVNEVPTRKNKNYPSSRASGKGISMKGTSSISRAQPSKPTRKPDSDSRRSQHVEITCMLMLWDYHCIATGSEDGAVCLWNADLGNKLISRSLPSTVTALVTAFSKKK